MNYFRAILPYGGAFSDDAVLPRKRNEYDADARIHFSMDEWPEEAFETAGIYAVSEAIRSTLESIGATGVSFAPCLVTKSSQFLEIFPELTSPLPVYFWMVVCGRSGTDDFGLDSLNKLTISERIATVFRNLDIQDLDLVPL